MVAMKSLITLLPFFLALTNALPQGSLQGDANAAADVEDPDVDLHENDSNNIELAASMEDAGIDVSSRWNKTGSDTSIDVDSGFAHGDGKIDSSSRWNSTGFASSVDGQFAAEMEEAGIDVSSRWNRTSSSTNVDVNLYRDKNPDYDVVIDPNTCEGNAEIALMKWRSNCKGFNAVFRGSCYTDAPSKQKCCPLAKRKSCEHYWPANGE
jgi:hypothetical protein